MTAQLSFGERPHLTTQAAHSLRKGHTRLQPSIYETDDEFPCGLLGFHIGILANGMGASRMDLYDRRFTSRVRRVSLWSPYDEWTTRNTLHSIRDIN